MIGIQSASSGLGSFTKHRMEDIMKRLISIGLFALALAAGEANAAVVVRFGPPPPPRQMMITRPGPGYVWVPGSYRWTRSRYVWSRGVWAIPPRHRTAWVPGYWAARRGGYVWIAGYWR